MQLTENSNGTTREETAKSNVRTYKDYIPRLQELYPGLLKKSIDRILREGLKGLLHYLLTGNSFLIYASPDIKDLDGLWVKFFPPIYHPGLQHAHAMKGLEIRDKDRAERRERLDRWKERSKKISKAVKKAQKERWKKYRAEKRAEERERVRNMSPEEKEVYLKELRAKRRAKRRAASKQQKQAK